MSPLAPAAAPAVAIVMAISGRMRPNARPGSSDQVSQSTSALPNSVKKAPGSLAIAEAILETVSRGISRYFAWNSAGVILPPQRRPRSPHRLGVPSNISLIMLSTPSNKPRRIEPAVRQAASPHVRSGSFAIPASSAAMSAVPESLTSSTSAWKSASAPCIVARPGPSSHEASNMGMPPSAAAWLRASALLFCACSTA